VKRTHPKEARLDFAAFPEWVVFEANYVRYHPAPKAQVFCGAGQELRGGNNCIAAAQDAFGPGWVAPEEFWQCAAVEVQYEFLANRLTHSANEVREHKTPAAINTEALERNSVPVQQSKPKHLQQAMVGILFIRDPQEDL
jgi:hypothetical protein